MATSCSSLACVGSSCTRTITKLLLVVVVYHVTIVAIGHGLLEKFWPFGNGLRSTHCREFILLEVHKNIYRSCNCKKNTVKI